MDVRIRKSKKVLNEIMSNLSISNIKQLSEALGHKRPENLYKIMRGKGSVSRRLAKEISQKYPQFDFEWILSGGNPLSEDAVELNETVFDSADDIQKILKFLLLYHNELKEFKDYQLHIRRIQREYIKEQEFNRTKESPGPIL